MSDSRNNLSKLPSPLLKKIFVCLDEREGHQARLNKNLNTIFNSDLVTKEYKSQEIFKNLLKFIIEGNYDSVKDILSTNPLFLLKKGKVTNFVGKTVDVTPLQLALDEMDEEMVELMQSIFSDLTDGKKLALTQVQELNVKFQPDEQKSQSYFKDLNTAFASNNESKIQASINSFKQMLQTKELLNLGALFYIDLLKTSWSTYINNTYSSGELCKRFHIEIIGYIQRFLPACFIQAYCNGLASAIDGENKLLRNFSIYDRYLGEVEIFPLQSDKGLGFDFCLFRQARIRAGELDHNNEIIALTKLCEMKSDRISKFKEWLVQDNKMTPTS